MITLSFENQVNIIRNKSLNQLVRVLNHLEYLSFVMVVMIFLKKNQGFLKLSIFLSKIKKNDSQLGTIRK